ncbi:hypothetical protein SPBR_04180 [Sporothrix brasiliensis 5110]|uniref:Aminoglycoside phosphotransferase domain-containing protein n=1 Tax=Sporothrix brasiliensis 5110 TaxID=1398154 RepID=A0A0C2J9Y9_9PEZI|nr:uncharacterized protein SPBR_04180 [Sporothrix brasiliensis 5110]KIH93732.1 hypothetical protein SPBR_04180 [Sporothrix brasiliensis 5110]
MVEKTFELDGKIIGYEEAIDWEDDFLQKKTKHDKNLAFLRDLYPKAASLEQLVAFYLKLDSRRIECNVSDSLQGGFNTVLAVQVHDTPENKYTKQRDVREHDWPQEGHNVILRFPTPASCGEDVHPGSILEKMRCEVAIAWLRIRQTIAGVCGRPVPSDYLPVTLPSSVKLPPNTGYLLLEFFGPSMGTLLNVAADSRIRPPSEIDPAKKQNLYRSFSRIMLSLARVPQPRIGAFRFNDDGTITLDNRPLVSTITIHESEGAPRTIPPNQTFSRVDDYIDSMISFHEHRFLAAPHAVVSRFDGQLQMAAWVFIRSLLPHFVNKRRNTGPFVLQLSDKNPCNFIVDDDWNVTAMYDLEFIIAAPVESMDAPSWLGWTSLDENASTGYSAYDAERSEFMDQFQEEELRMIGTATPLGARLSDVMNESWRSERLWLFATVLGLNGVTQLAEHRFEPLFGSNGFPRASSLYRIWRMDAEDVLAKKEADNDRYLAQVAALFGRGNAAGNSKAADVVLAEEAR